MSCQQVSRQITTISPTTITPITSSTSAAKTAIATTAAAAAVVVARTAGTTPTTTTTSKITTIQPEGATTVAIVTPEDPYVFTETVPNTPILFTAQKSRPRLVETANTIATGHCNQKLPLTPLNGKIAKKISAATPAFHHQLLKQQQELATLGNLSTVVAIATNLKQQTKQSQPKRQQTPNAQPKRVSPNVCIVRPQQQQQQQKLQHAQQQLKQRQPSLESQQLVLQHTPSLWQTPLLLEPTTVAPTNAATVTVAAISPTAKLSPKQQQPQQEQLQQAITTTTPATLPLCINATTTTPTVASASATITKTPIAAVATAPTAQAVIASPPLTATALVTPLMQSGAGGTNAAVTTLPPSRFHSTTLAQHLQKVECLKKPKKPLALNGVSNASEPTSMPQYDDASTKLGHSTVTPTSLGGGSIMPPLQALEAPKHSDPDLSEIPVNVIFRKPQMSPVAADEALANQPEQPNSCDAKEQPQLQQQQQQQQKELLQQNSVKSTAIAPNSPLNRSASTPPAPTLQQNVLFAQPILKSPNTFSAIAPAMSSTPTQPSTMLGNSVINSPLPTPIASKSKKSDKSTPTQMAMMGVRRVIPGKRKLIPKATTYKKGSRKSLNAAIATVMMADERIGAKHAANNNSRAVAVVKMTEKEVSTDTSLMSSPVVLPYCLQRHWVGGVAGMRLLDVSAAPHDREQRIQQYKSQLRRQALQLLAIKPLQKLPLHEARRRLLCVDNLLRKYQNHSDFDESGVKQCTVDACSNQTLTMANYCHLHISHNTDQQIFLPCTAKSNTNSNLQCRMPVLNIANELPPLCANHSRQAAADTANIVAPVRGGVFAHIEPRSAVKMSSPAFAIRTASTGAQLQYNQQLIRQHQQKEQQPQQPQLLQLQQQSQPQQKQLQQQHIQVGVYKKTNGEKPTQMRKRKIGTGNPVGRPQKRSRKSPIMNTAPTLPPLSAVLQRKSSTTSLESIASNSYSSSSQPAINTTPTMQNVSCNSNNNNNNNNNNNVLPPPALAPLSTYNNINNNSDNGNTFNNATTQSMLNFGASASIAADLKEHEINEIVTQLAMVAHNNNNNNNYNHNSNNHQNHHHNHNPNYNHHHHTSYSSTNSNSNFTSVLGSATSLPPSSSSTEELLTQDMLGICENSSTYASSEDTGLGGLSENELLSGPHDADEIPLGDAHLLEEHDLANVLSSLPVEAFSELFTAVRQDERDEVERALELADKHLKSLQQTIGSESDFLGDLLDVNDDILTECSKMDIVSSVMHSPDTSNADTASLYFDNGSINSNVNNSTGGNCSTITDIRGLVQT